MSTRLPAYPAPTAMHKDLAHQLYMSSTVQKSFSREFAFLGYLRSLDNASSLKLTDYAFSIAKLNAMQRPYGEFDLATAAVQAVLAMRLFDAKAADYEFELSKLCNAELQIRIAELLLQSYKIADQITAFARSLNA